MKNNKKDSYRLKNKNKKVKRNDNFFEKEVLYFYNNINGFVQSFALNVKKMRLAEGKVSYRVLSHWEKLDLISFKKDKEKGWRKYSIVDLVWLEIILILRNFGLPLPDILKIKKYLEMGEWENKPTQFPLLEMYIANAYELRIPTYLLVFQDGIAEPLTHFEYMDTMNNMRLEDHLRISINDILNELFPDKRLYSHIYKYYHITEEEFEAIKKIRKERKTGEKNSTFNYEDVYKKMKQIVNGKNGMKMMEELEKIKNEEKAK